MKCEQVQELFPELMDKAERYPEACKHLETCSSCKALFHIFKGFTDENHVKLEPLKRDKNFMSISKKLRRHDRVVFIRRASSVAAVFLLAIVSIFNLNRSTDISIASISDDVLFLQSGTSMVPEISMNDNEIIEYLAQYENIEALEDLF